MVRDEDLCVVELRQKKGGFFATVEQPMVATLPLAIPVDVDIKMDKGVLALELDRQSRGFLDMELGDVDLMLSVPDGLALKVELADGVAAETENEVPGMNWDGVKRRWKQGDEPVMKLRVKAWGGGSFSIVRPIR